MFSVRSTINSVEVGDVPALTLKLPFKVAVIVAVKLIPAVFSKPSVVYECSVAANSNELVDGGLNVPADTSESDPRTVQFAFNAEIPEFVIVTVSPGTSFTVSVGLIAATAFAPLFETVIETMVNDIVLVDGIPAIVTKSPSVKVSDTEAVVIFATVPEDDTTHWEIVLDTAASSAATRTRSELSVKL